LAIRTSLDFKDDHGTWKRVRVNGLLCRPLLWKPTLCEDSLHRHSHFHSYIM
jgi:hypothetical protein